MFCQCLTWAAAAARGSWPSSTSPSWRWGRWPACTTSTSMTSSCSGTVLTSTSAWPDNRQFSMEAKFGVWRDKLYMDFGYFLERRQYLVEFLFRHKPIEFQMEWQRFWPRHHSEKAICSRNMLRLNKLTIGAVLLNVLTYIWYIIKQFVISKLFYCEFCFISGLI